MCNSVETGVLGGRIPRTAFCLGGNCSLIPPYEPLSYSIHLLNYCPVIVTVPDVPLPHKIRILRFNCF